MDFPYREYNDADLLEEFFKLRYREYNELKRGRTGYKCSNAFFQRERMLSSSLSKLSGVEFWSQNKRYVKNYYKRGGASDMFGAVQFLNHIPSQFPPTVAAYVYSAFGARNVLDPFAGWGDRCLAAMALNINYTGIDSNKDLKKCFDKMVKFYPRTSSVKMFYTPFEKVNLDALNFNLVFSSPPFWEPSGQLSEVYKHMSETKHNDFVKMFVKFIKYCVKVRKVPCCFYMSEYMASTIPIRFRYRLRYAGVGNKRNQVYSIYCYMP